jgi:hypothetical protein
MVIVSCGELAISDSLAGAELNSVLGCDVPDAAAFAGELLRHPHPLVATGAGLWVRADMTTPEVTEWRAGLPEEVDTGDIPSWRSKTTASTPPAWSAAANVNPAIPPPAIPTVRAILFDFPQT